MKIYFIRHAQKLTDADGSPLTKKGVKQAKLLAKRLKGKRFDEFYCSEFFRAKQTAEIVSKKIKMKPVIEPSLNEFGMDLIKKPLTKWSKKEKKHYKDLFKFLKKITKNPEEKKSVLIVCHGVTNRIILSYLFNINMKSLVPFTQNETGINKVYWKETHKNWRLVCWNDYSHLPKKLR